jgi:hypothetical protein
MLDHMILTVSNVERSLALCAKLRGPESYPPSPLVAEGHGA